MAKIESAKQTVKLTITPNEDLYDFYSERAAKAGSEVEAEVLKTLSRCRDHNATSAIYLDDAARNEISQIAGKLIRTPEDLLAWAKQSSILNVGGVEVPISTLLAGRLRSRTFGLPWQEHIRKTVTEVLEQSVGLR